MSNSLTRTINNNMKEIIEDLTTEDLTKAIDELKNAIPQARDKDLDKWSSRASTPITVNKITYEAGKPIRVFAARLLTEEEFVRHLYAIPEITYKWYLDSSNETYKTYSYYGPDPDHADIVCQDHVEIGSVIGNYAIRPVIEIASLNESEMKPGDSFDVKGYTFTLLSPGLAICNTPISHGRYADQSNKYESSKAKAAIDKWFKKLIK